MSYCTGKNIENARGKAIKLLVIERIPVGIIANRYGVHRSTIWRWYQKWLERNQDWRFTNAKVKNRLITNEQLRCCRWTIPTIPSAPLNPHTLSQELIELVLNIRDQLKRCSEVVWHYINHTLCVRISLSSVRRILKRHHRLDKTKRHKNRAYKGIRRPKALLPGALIETDTIHLYNPISKTKRYLYTVIDVYTRMAYAKIYSEIKPKHAITTVLEAERYMGFKFRMVQSDNGLEFSEYFAGRLRGKGIQIRHTRLGRPNDNAHIERFNRTIQEECTGNYYLESESLKTMDDKILSYIDFYNYKRVHLGLEYRVPAEMLHRF